MLILIKYKLQIKKPTRLLRGNCCRMIEQTFFPEGPLRMATAEGDGSKQIKNSKLTATNARFREYNKNLMVR